MRILITNTASWGTGSGMVTDGIMRGLRAKGHQVLAVYLDSGLHDAAGGKYYDHPETYRLIHFPATHDGVFLRNFAVMIADPNPRDGGLCWTYKDMTNRELTAYFSYLRSELIPILEEFKPDVIECQHIWAFDHILEEMRCRRFISVAHHSDQLAFAFDERMQPITTKSCAAAAFIFAISDSVRDEVINLYGVAPEKVITIPNAYDKSIFMPAKLDRNTVLADAGIKTRKDMPIITFGGKVSLTKGIDVLLRANNIIQKECPSLLVITGHGQIDDLSANAQKDLCLDNTVFLGHRPQTELARLHNIARLSVMPSRSEGFGLGAIEAMGCGLPVVATRVGGLESFAVGELVEPENENALAQAILKILQMPDKEYQDLKNKALRSAQQYSWEAVVDQRLKYYELVCNSAGEK